MRSIPAAITNGFTNSYLAFWVVMVEASGGNTYYWTTASVNRTGNAFTLKKTAGGGALSPDATMIAAKDWATGEEYDGIGPMESGADIYEGGGVALVSDLEIQILNQARFDETIIQNSINIENRPITIYFGFIPDGASQTVVIDDDMFMRWAGVVEDVMEFDYQIFVLRCVDGSFQRHKDIPQTIITKEDYAYAATEAVGEPIPLLYGDFWTANNTVDPATNPGKTETFSPVPVVLIDVSTHQFAICAHARYSPTSFHGLIYNGGSTNFGVVSSVISQTDTATLGTITMSGDEVLANLWFQPHIEGGDSTASTFVAAIDDDLTTYETVASGANGTLFVRFLKGLSGFLPSPGTSGTITLTISLGTVSGGGSGHLRYKKDGDVETNLAEFTSADSDTDVNDTIGITSLADIPLYQLGIIVDGGTAQIKNICGYVVVAANELGKIEQVQVVSSEELVQFAPGLW